MFRKLSEMDLLRQLEEECQRQIRQEVILRALSTLNLAVQPTPGERLFRYSVQIASSLGIGCCFATTTGTTDSTRDTLIGTSVLPMTSNNIELETRIAILDSIYAPLTMRPSESLMVAGSIETRSRKRADFVIDRTMSIARLYPGDSLLNVGAVGAFISAASRRGLRISATDRDPLVVNTMLSGTLVLDAAMNRELLAAADVALVSGMTLWTETLCQLLADAQEAGTPVVIFAETGANLFPSLIGRGIMAVFSEPFPFYVLADECRIHFYT